MSYYPNLSLENDIFLPLGILNCEDFEDMPTFVNLVFHMFQFAFDRKVLLRCSF